MANQQPEDIGADFLIELIDTIDDNEKAALRAIRDFVESVDAALPGGGTKQAPGRRVELVEAALDMIEKLLGVSNDAAQRLTESIREALPQIEEAAQAAARKAPARSRAVKKKAPAKKAPAKRTAAKKSPAKKATAKKAPAKKSPAKRTAKKAPAKRTAAKKTPAKKTPAKKAPAKRTAAKKAPARR
jgi:hypothetical protein